jgi:hypothetical protein
MLIGSAGRENVNQNNPENEIMISDEHTIGISLDHDMIVSVRASTEVLKCGTKSKTCYSVPRKCAFIAGELTIVILPPRAENASQNLFHNFTLSS